MDKNMHMSSYNIKITKLTLIKVYYDFLTPTHTSFIGLLIKIIIN